MNLVSVSMCSIRMSLSPSHWDGPIGVRPTRCLSRCLRLTLCLSLLSSISLIQTSHLVSPPEAKEPSVVFLPVARSMSLGVKNSLAPESDEGEQTLTRALVKAQSPTVDSSPSAGNEPQTIATIGNEKRKISNATHTEKEMGEEEENREAILIHSPLLC